jgi:hypothetical protein
VVVVVVNFVVVAVFAVVVVATVAVVAGGTTRTAFGFCVRGGLVAIDLATDAFAARGFAANAGPLAVVMPRLSPNPVKANPAKASPALKAR